MDIELKNKKVHISMANHLKSAIETYKTGLGMISKKLPSTPGKADMFNNGKETDQLNDKESEIFHTAMAKLLHVCKQARLGIKPVVAYLCTQVS